MQSNKFRTKNKYSFASEFVATRQIAGFSVRHAGKLLCRHERTIDDWETGKTPCPAWATRLLMLESRYMDALYGLQRDRSRSGNALGTGRTTMAANDREFDQKQLKLHLIVSTS